MTIYAEKSKDREDLQQKDSVKKYNMKKRFIGKSVERLRRKAIGSVK